MEGGIMADLRLSGMGGTPYGNTAARPSSPSVGQTYNNGQLGIVEIYTESGWVAVGGAPASVPTSVVATNVPSSRAFNDGKASIAFSAGEGGGLTIDYAVTPYPPTSPATFTGTSSPIVVTGLSSNTDYYYYVQARNNFGTSLFSSPSATIKATTAPQAPVITSAYFTSSSTVEINFTCQNGGSTVSEYTVTSSGGQTATGTSSPITVSGLSDSTTYTFTVTATNANGTSPASASSSSIAAASVQYLSVAGGGGGGGITVGGGGGAGGLLTSTTKMYGLITILFYFWFWNFYYN
jgi:hypothetical protein